MQAKKAALPGEQTQEEIPMQEQIPQVEDGNEDIITLVLMALEEDGLDEEALVAYKSRYGNVYISQVHEDGRAYLWKKLSRGEYKQIVESGAMAKELSYQDAVLRKCLLLPKPEQGFFMASDAGTIPTLFKQIMFQSGFVPEQYALSLITEI